MQLATGQTHECPFRADLIREGRELIFLALNWCGAKLPVHEPSAGQPFFLAALEEIFRISGDPDYRAFYSGANSFAKGVRRGVGVKAPRVPAVLLPKTKWRNYAETGVAEDSCRENYVSARQQAKVVQEQFEGEARLGAMLKMPMSEAVKKFERNLAIASLGALEKRDGSYRVIHDATHGLDVNSAIRMRDQVPTATDGELRALLQTEPGVTFGLTGDVQRAHCLVKVDPLDRGRQACRTVSPHGWVRPVGILHAWQGRG